MGASRGFTLTEVIMVMALSMFVFVAVIGLGSQMSRTTMTSRRQAGAQMDAAYALRLIDGTLRQATLVSRPATGAGAVLEGCSNAAVMPGDGSPTALDSSRAMGWFAFCASGPTVHFHEGTGCPGTYSCGSGSSMSFGQPESPASATFTRPGSPATQVDVAVSVSVKDRSSSLQTSVAFAGSNQ